MSRAHPRNPHALTQASPRREETPNRSFPRKSDSRRPEGDYLYGVHPVAECIRAGRRALKRLYVSDRERLRDLAEAAGREINLSAEVVGRDTCQHLCGSGNHQGVVLLVGPYPYVDWQDLLDPSPTPLLLVLDNLTDPQNVGAILRSALCAGATGVTLRKHHAALVTTAVVKASAGASEHLRVALVPNQALFLRASGEAGLWRVALSMDGDSLWDSGGGWDGGLVLAVGAEGRGLSRLVEELCDARVSIPMSPGFDSLNASVAASLALFEAARRRFVARPGEGF